jgi:hypothetical protein
LDPILWNAEDIARLSSSRVGFVCSGSTCRAGRRRGPPGFLAVVTIGADEFVFRARCNRFEIAVATSDCNASTSLRSPSKDSAQRCLSARASISCAVILTWLPARSTERSTAASTSSARAISFTGYSTTHAPNEDMPRATSSLASAELFEETCEASFPNLTVGYRAITGGFIKNEMSPAW